jgi:hypothetical protein
MWTNSPLSKPAEFQPYTNSAYQFFLSHTS